MSDRWVFVTASLTAVLIVAGAFALPQFFGFELAKSTIFIAIGVLVFFGEDKYSYMLGLVAPVLWFVVDIFVGGLGHDFRVLFRYLGGQDVGPVNTPLDGFARIAAIFLAIFAWRAWHRQVSEKFFGKAFFVCVVIAIIYVVVVAAWYVTALPAHGGVM